MSKKTLESQLYKGLMPLDCLREKVGKYGYKYMKLGDMVKSCYRARWYGKIVYIGLHSDKETPYIVVKVTHSPDGRKRKKPIYSGLHPYWLELIDGIPERISNVWRKVNI